MLSPNKIKTLTFLGAIPFVCALIIAVYDHYNLMQTFGYELKFGRFKSYLIAHSYGAVIVGFLAGIQWGLALNQDKHPGYLISSNLLALLAWLSLFALASFKGVMMIAMAIIFAWLIDRNAYRAGLIPEWFWQLRTHISTLVLATLFLLLYFNR